nr:MAG TPA: hypothetical protein [Bacteriophage sp.]
MRVAPLLRGCTFKILRAVFFTYTVTWSNRSRILSTKNLNDKIRLDLYFPETYRRLKKH